MVLALDPRHRAMLLEMGVRVWLPDTAVATATSTSNATSTPTAAPGASAGATRPPVALAASGPVVTPRPIPLASPVEGAAVPADWSALATSVAGCSACGLCAGRKNSTLQPLAAQRADWMVVGDPPDEDEDRSAAAFADQSGLLLDNMLRAVGAQRGTTAYVTNVVKCRPPHGRVPQPAELASCAHFLQRELALVQPKVILAMGRFANQVLLGDSPGLASQPLGKLRGTVHRYAGVAVVVTYHPKVLMRSSADKAKAWADLCLAAEIVDAAHIQSHHDRTT